MKGGIVGSRCKIILLALLIVLLPVRGYSREPISEGNRIVLMWQVQKDVTDQDLAIMNGKGVNIIQSFRIRQWNEKEIASYLDRARTAGMKVIIPLTSFVKKKGNSWVVAPGMGDVAFIKKWKDNPALFAWQLFDEPANPDKRIPASVQEEAYRRIKVLDPKAVVYQSWNGTSDDHYRCCFSEDSFDILDIHAYVSDGIGKRQKKLLEEFRKHRMKTYPVVITLRVCDGPDLKKDLPPDGLRNQYDFFFKKNKVTKNIGFYGWDLNPNRGINQVPDIMRQFKAINLD